MSFEIGDGVVDDDDVVVVDKDVDDVVIVERGLEVQL